MTIEDKAKAYDEVRKKIAIRFGSNVANEIFSQFEESEDERINEWLINLVKRDIEWLEDRIREQLSNGQVYGDELVKAKNSLAWLEKQGKISDKIVERARTEKQRILVTESDGVANIDWDTRSLQDAKFLMEYGLNYIKKKLEKQGEKPIKIGSKNAVGKLKELIEKQWYDYSNADIKQKDYAEKQNTNDGFHPLIVEEIDLWIKENENVHHNDKNIIGVMRDMAYQVSALTKNLYNQKQWKPSDEQMEALLYEVNAWDEDSVNGQNLKSLYEQLKKLKRE